MNCGRRDFSPATRASTGRRRDMIASPIWRRARCARSSTRRKSHKVRYYLERRDPDFAEKMAEVLCVYRKVKLLKKAAAAAKKPNEAVAVISYDEKPGIQALATTAPDLPPEPGVHPAFARDHEYKRHGT